MKILRNSIGWEDENGMQLAFDKEHAMFNTERHPNHKRPIWEGEQWIMSSLKNRTIHLNRTNGIV